MVSTKRAFCWATNPQPTELTAGQFQSGYVGAYYQSTRKLKIIQNCLHTLIKMMKSIYKLGGIYIVFLALGIASCQKIPSEEVNLIVAADHKAQFLNPWLDLHLEMIKLTSGYSPPVASRTIGYTYLALYESVQHGMPGYQSLNERYAIDSNYPQPDLGQHYHWPAAATASMAYMLRHLFPLASSSFKTQIDVLEQADSLRYASTVDITVLELSLIHI